ncbi:hypothetical protein A0H81_12228 [Grifola frondosa]|uniref:Uncharacterized protein n=1 Tax=Grifola frondosa TaxID=5627 RepID=A0A1C7LUY5_GRIFR|nr:hypothetical protein A0H81_12228 [Grifola frondosa]
MILRDGTLYFIVLLFFNVGDIIFLQVAINATFIEISTWIWKERAWFSIHPRVMILLEMRTSSWETSKVLESRFVAAAGVLNEMVVKREIRSHVYCAEVTRFLAVRFYQALL